MMSAALTDAAGGITLGLAEIEALVRDALIRAGAAAEVAGATARRIGEAEARGLRDSGLAPLPDTIAALRSGRVDGAARPALRSATATRIEIDGCHGLAAPAVELGLPTLLEASARSRAVLVVSRVAASGDVASVALSIAAAGRLALVRGAEGQDAAARPGVEADRPERITPAGPDVAALRPALAAWQPATDWPTGPVGDPVDGMLVAVAAPPDTGMRGLSTCPTRRDRVVVPAALLAEIVNA